LCREEVGDRARAASAVGLVIRSVGHQARLRGPYDGRLTQRRLRRKFCYTSCLPHRFSAIGFVGARRAQHAVREGESGGKTRKGIKTRVTSA